jgi:hypothetical protein
MAWFSDPSSNHKPWQWRQSSMAGLLVGFRPSVVQEGQYLERFLGMKSFS